MVKLAVLTTHPIQYYAPIFQRLAKIEDLCINVYYTWGEGCLKDKYDPGFGKNIEWDIPLLDDYPYQFLENTSKNPGSHHFRGIVNPTLTQEVERWGAEVILVFGWSYHSHLQAMRYFKGRIPVYFRGDSHLLDEKLWYNRLIRKGILNWVYSHVDKVFYVGFNNKDYYLAHGVKENQLIWAPHAIDNNRFTDSEGIYTHKARKWREELGIPASAIVLLFAGKFESKKNPGILIEAAKQLDRQKFYWVFAGNGRLEKELKSQAAELTNIRFLPFQNQSKMPILYRLADIFVLPSNGPGETWGLAINEAMASGCAIIASDRVGCAVDLVKGNGYIIKHKDVEHFTDSVLLLSNAKNLSSAKQVSSVIINSWSMDCLINQIKSALPISNQVNQKKIQSNE